MRSLSIAIPHLLTVFSSHTNIVSLDDAAILTTACVEDNLCQLITKRYAGYPWTITGLSFDNRLHCNIHKVASITMALIVSYGSCIN